MLMVESSMDSPVRQLIIFQKYVDIYFLLRPVHVMDALTIWRVAFKLAYYIHARQVEFRLACVNAVPNTDLRVYVTAHELPRTF